MQTDQLVQLNLAIPPGVAVPPHRAKNCSHHDTDLCSFHLKI